jgi:hypothetical protein
LLSSDTERKKWKSRCNGRKAELKVEHHRIKRPWRLLADIVMRSGQAALAEARFLRFQ